MMQAAARLVQDIGTMLINYIWLGLAGGCAGFTDTEINNLPGLYTLYQSWINPRFPILRLDQLSIVAEQSALKADGIMCQSLVSSHC